MAFVASQYSKMLGNTLLIHQAKRALAAAALSVSVAFFALSPPAEAGQYGYLGSFEAIGDGPNVQWTRLPGYKAGGLFTSVGDPSVANVNFRFATPGYPAGQYPEELEALFALNQLGDLAAAMTITSTPIDVSENCQPCARATLKFTYLGADPLTVDGTTYLAGANLLTVGPAYGITGQAGHFSNWYYSSDFLSIKRLNSVAGFGEIFLDVTPPLVVRDGGIAVDDYVGTFRSGYFFGGVPEPTTWAMMILGFGMAGSAIRWRARAAGKVG